MATIQEAATWMQEGKKVWRNHDVAKWQGFCRMDNKRSVEFERFDGSATLPLRVDDLLADDWEIAD